MSFLIWLLTSISMVSQQVIWENDHLIIKLGESVSLYQDLPTAHLFINGVRVIDQDMFIEQGIERTFLSTVNTGIVKSYTIKYRVTFPNYGVENIGYIVFQVVDDVPPSIDFMPTFDIPLGSKMPNILEGLRVSDNYDKKENLIITTKVAEVILTRIGTFKIEYHVTDQSNNVSIGYSYITIYDALPPVISLKTPIILEYKQAFVWQDFITVKDNYDLNPVIEIDDHAVDYETLGTYRMTLTSTDQSGNSDSLVTSIVIVDLEKPIIKLKSNPKVITVFSHITREILEDYIFSVSDNHDDLIFKDVLITDDIDVTRVGEYTITFQLTDSSFNQASTSLKVKVVDDVKPTIDITKPLVLDVFNPSPYLIEYFDFKDNYSETSDLVIKFTGTIDMKKLGRYLITIEVVDQSKNKTTGQYFFEVIDQVAPILILKADIIILDFKPKDYRHYVHATDNYDPFEALVISYDDSAIDYNVIGRYEVLLCVTDISANQSCDYVDVMILDVIPPTLILSHYNLTIDISQDTLDLMTFIDHLDDNYDQMESIELEVLSQIEFGVIGLYEVVFRASDTSYNQSIQTLIVKIDHLHFLTYTFTHLDMMQDDLIDFLEGLNIEGNELEYKVLYDAQHVNFSIPGYYEINYVIIDQRGRHYQFTRGLTVHAVIHSSPITNYFPLIILNGLFLGVIYYLWRKN